jgi:hypothetical protein
MNINTLREVLRRASPDALMLYETEMSSLPYAEATRVEPIRYAALGPCEEPDGLNIVWQYASSTDPLEDSSGNRLPPKEVRLGVMVLPDPCMREEMRRMTATQVLESLTEYSDDGLVLWMVGDNMPFAMHVSMAAAGVCARRSWEDEYHSEYYTYRPDWSGEPLRDDEGNPIPVADIQPAVILILNEYHQKKLCSDQA